MFFYSDYVYQRDQLLENSETVVKSCPSDESVESIDPYKARLESDDDMNQLRTVMQKMRISPHHQLLHCPYCNISQM